MRKHRLVTGSLLITCAVGFLSSVAISAKKGGGDIEHARAAVEKWVETQRIISEEKRDWELAKEMLNERVELVQREIESLRGKISEAEESISDAEKKRAELVEENEKLKSSSATLRDIVTEFEARTAALIKRLPDPIRERIQPLSQSMPDDPNETKLSLGQRFQNLIGILDMVNKFNRDITVTSEVRALADGSAAEVTVLYLGVGQAYYASNDGTVAGVGRPSEDGWTWEPANDAAALIADAIAIWKNEKGARFVPLPVKIQ
jgi:FtsZ-binding cell division protein ZapB